MKSLVGLLSLALLLSVLSGGPAAQAAGTCGRLFVSKAIKLSDTEILNHLASSVSKRQALVTSATVSKLASDLGLSLEEVSFHLARLAATRHRAAVSNFGVGAVGITSSGDAILGANIEFPGAALGLTVHAERAVLFLALEMGLKIEKLYSTVTPCGGCRQWLNEIEGASKLSIVSRDASGKMFSATLSDLLPRDFGPGHLGQKGALDVAQYRRHRAEWTWPESSRSLNQVEAEALLSALERSYSPYSMISSAVLVRMKDGTFETASSVEGVAYESYPALAVLVAKLNLTGRNPSQIESVVLAESPSVGTVVVDNLAMNRLVLSSLQQNSGFLTSLIDKTTSRSRPEIPLEYIVLQKNGGFTAMPGISADVATK